MKANPTIKYLTLTPDFPLESDLLRHWAQHGVEIKLASSAHRDGQCISLTLEFVPPAAK